MERKTQSLPSGTPEVGQKVEIPLDVAKRLFFQSFRFSQGNTALQYFIFDYLHLIRPEWEMSDSLVQQVEAEIKQPILRFLTAKPTMHTQLLMLSYKFEDVNLEKQWLDQDSNVDIRDGLKSMQEAFNTTDKPFDVLDTTCLIIEQDFRFLSSINGRPRVSMIKERYSPAQDPLLSHICYYGFEGNSTGIEEFDRMFKDVGKTALDILQGTLVVPEPMEPLLNPKTKDQLITVVDKYAATHPQSVSTLKNFGFPLGHIA